MTNYNDGKWWGWNGGECPVHPKTLVQWVQEDTFGETGMAGRFFWREHETGIVAFRVVEEHKEPAKPREFWVGDGYCFDSEINAHLAGVRNVIRVSEVLEDVPCASGSIIDDLVDVLRELRGGDLWTQKAKDALAKEKDGKK